MLRLVLLSNNFQQIIVATAASLLAGCTLASTSIAQISTEPATASIELPGSLLFVSQHKGYDALYNITSIEEDAEFEYIFGGEYDIFNLAITRKVDKIAFGADAEGERSIYVGDFRYTELAAKITGVRRITSITEVDAHPQWSGNGRKLAYDRNPETAAFAAILTDVPCPVGAGTFIYDLEAQLIEPYSVEFCAANATWSPNGRDLAFVGPSVSRTNSPFVSPGVQIHAAPVDIQMGTLRHPDILHISSPGNVFDPQWSPDGKWIAYTQLLNLGGFPVPRSEQRIILASANGLGERILVEDGNDNIQVAWSPDSKYVAYSSNRNGNFDIYVQALAGGEPIQITDSPANDWSPEWYAAPAAGTIWTLLSNLPSLNEPTLWVVAIILVLGVLLAIKLAWSTIRREVKKFNEENR